MTFEHAIALINTLIWPVIVVGGCLFFRKLIAYFTLSIEDYNIFGFAGKLKPIKQVIDEAIVRKKDEDTRDLTVKTLEKELSSKNLKDDNELFKVAQKAVALAERFKKEITLLEGERDGLKNLLYKNNDVSKFSQNVIQLLKDKNSSN